MKTIRPVFSFGLSLSFAIASFAVTATAQTGAPFSSQMNALGGKFASPGMGRPLGGINNPRGGPGGGQRRGGQPAVAVPYGYSYYVPGYFDSLGFSSVGTPSSVAEYNAASWPAVLPSSSPALAPQTATAPSVIINQYFNGSPVGSGSPLAAQQAGEAPRAAGEPLGPVENYYLIAYKDHSVYAVLAYWLEDKTLHYVTTHNVHNQASLDLIDLDLTKSLNQARDVPFTLAAPRGQ